MASWRRYASHREAGSALRLVAPEPSDGQFDQRAHPGARAGTAALELKLDFVPGFNLLPGLGCLLASRSIRAA